MVDEIIVIDSYSTDKTKLVCKQFDLKFIQHKFLDFADQKNYGNSLAKHNYILNLDADERLSDELAQSIAQLKQNAVNSMFYLKRKNYFCGKWLKYGGNYPNKKLRLFDKTKARWQGKLHEKVMPLNSKTQSSILTGDIIHLAFDNLEEHKIKIKKYAFTMAGHLREKGVKSNRIKIIVKPLFLFFNMFFFKLGFLDGKLGYVYSRNSAYAKYLRYKELRRLWEEN